MNNKLLISLCVIPVILLVLVFTSIAKAEPLVSVNEPNAEFIKTHNEVKEFYKKHVGRDVTTQTVEIEIWDPNSAVIAYCRPGQQGVFPQYITFNHVLLKKLAITAGEDVIFQVILHEYVHCEGAIGHIQMPGHFMNDGGNPKLTKDETKKQFIDFLEYYRKFYNVKKTEVNKVPEIKDDGDSVPQ